MQMNNSEILSELKDLKNGLMLLRTSQHLRDEAVPIESDDQFDPMIAALYIEDFFWKTKPEEKIEKIEQAMYQRISQKKKK